ncbi:tRNA (N(6)-L-threonylcarbamoyladenosine(37)-C(2))-methylthiotransferase MtaB [Helicobacter ailurogastricus]|uniref:tRNA-t(6)A37 methylthiotransferase n=1 Tax=Helicobacter ailurogastricus TaxID=1578720 RepID=A0A0K2X3M6_9HELI|nr:tRNA (N(6)-L-threonylcarbamoyladenosine(37)-C(2))-methylthiotransferase MtaB [Helicobacter ailurogastricus]CRF40391.1 tRNA-t(6)A37 methylthiotransferase [Helicobacter ailurogastricus]CRF42546.1 tRNA-t(6)A37 methylthiotransferase [Helicobacter ailurogastricus]CRF44506.1 tRNA-t(6)A37 methylthiotransferase [Helicobacter ailurogastricus]
MKQKVYFKTFGCRTNLFDTQVMLAHLKDFEHTNSEELADIVVLNSCTVTNDADYSARAYAKKMHALNKKVYFTGCGANKEGRKLLENKQVSGVFGHDHKTQINRLLSQEGFFYEDKQTELESTLLTNFVGKTRAFVKIQEGCDFKCSYCIIPLVRGKSRSLERTHILKQIDLLAQAGILEVVLTGTNVGSFGLDRGDSLAKLVKEIAKTPIKRVRIGSLEPAQIDAEFLELLDHPILEKHLHIALQHSHDTMLRWMRRRNRTHTDMALLEKVASKGFAIGTDFIVGHPHEDENIWQEALDNFKKLPLTHIHPFIYSVRSGTPSSKMPNRVNGNIAKERLNQIKNCVQNNNLAFRQSLKAQGVALEVLVEGFKGGVYLGHDQFFNPVHLSSQEDLSGRWVVLTDYEVRADASFAAL